MKLTQRFGPIPLTVVLDGSGNGTVTFQPNGSSARVTNLFVKVATATAQATCTIYKGQVSDGNAVNTTNSGSTGATASGAIDLTDGETLYVRWTGGDAGATATATFTGITIPFDQVGPSQLVWADPIAAGDGSLIFPALKSPNYVTGVSGWKIARNGDAEFNDIDVRGSAVFGTPGGERIELTTGGDLEIYTAGGVLLATINEAGIKFYDSGNVVAWIDNVAMTFQDTLGNSIDITTDAAFGAQVLFNTADPVGLGISSGRAYATTFPGQDNAPVLVLQSPYMSSPIVRNYARIYIIGDDGAANPAKIDFRTGGGPVSVLDGANLIVTGRSYLPWSVCRARDGTGGAALTSSAWTAIPLDGESIDTDNWHSTTVNNSRITPTLACRARVYGGVAFTGNAAGPRRGAGIRFNSGGSLLSGSAQMTDKGTTASNLVVGTIPTIVDFNGTTDYVEVMGWVEGGAGTTVVASPFASSLTVEVIQLL